MLQSFGFAALLAGVHISTCSDLSTGCADVVEVPEPESGRALLQLRSVLPERAMSPEAAPTSTDAQAIANTTQTALANAGWTDLGAGCCSRSQAMAHGGLHAGNESSLDACKAKCLDFDNCGHVEYGWSRGADQRCVVWAASEACSLLDEAERDCGGNGSTGVHTYRFNKSKVLLAAVKEVETYKDVSVTQGGVANTTVPTLQDSQDALKGLERSADLAVRQDVSEAAAPRPAMALAASTQADAQQAEFQDRAHGEAGNRDEQKDAEQATVMSNLVSQMLAMMPDRVISMLHGIGIVNLTSLADTHRAPVKREEFFPPLMCFAGIIIGLSVCCVRGARMRD
mmetsp:Transcript_105991/g.187741  ORF Transcript_105991/g.187741 Transcript_105991/m.187741 type:complete len:341 (-) Transcript_105991:64-1086(-)